MDEAQIRDGVIAAIQAVAPEARAPTNCVPIGRCAIRSTWTRWTG